MWTDKMISKILCTTASCSAGQPIGTHMAYGGKKNSYDKLEKCALLRWRTHSYAIGTRLELHSYGIVGVPLCQNVKIYCLVQPRLELWFGNHRTHRGWILDSSLGHNLKAHKADVPYMQPCSVRPKRELRLHVRTHTVKYVVPPATLYTP